MRILELNTYYGYGSTGKIVEDLCRYGLQMNHEMYAVYWLKKNKSSAIYCGNMHGKNSILKLLEWVFNGGKISYNKNITNRIIDVIKKISPDIIHIHNLHGDFEMGSLDIPLLFKAISKMESKIVWTLHDCWAFTGRCYHFEYKNCDRWKNGCGKCPQIIFDRQGILRDFSSKNWNIKKNLYSLLPEMNIITVSNWLEKKVKQSILSDNNILTIYNGINTEIYTPYGDLDENITKMPGKKILCIGWDRRKGCEDYYKLARIIGKENTIIVVGKRPLFRRSRHLPQNIVEIEYKNNANELAKVYRSVDVYFNSSRAETFGLTTVEAISCGTPAIVYNNTASPEIINSQNEIGRVIEKGELDNFMEIINSLNKDIVSMEKRHRWAIDRFNRIKMIDKYFELYIKLYMK